MAILAALIWLAAFAQRHMLHPTESLPVSPSIAQPTRPETASGVLPASPELMTSTVSPASVLSTQSQLAHSIPSSTPNPIYHEVQPGEVPGVIAAAYGISVDLLMHLNDISDPTKLQIGQKLLVPVTVTPTSANPPTPNPSPSPTAAPLYYTIESGDVLLAIAAEHDTTVEAIMIANDITDPRTLQIGQKLLIPPDKGSILGVPTKIHEIKSGDTLLGLGLLYGSTLEDILATNPDLDPERLQVGQKIIIPLTQPRSNPQANPTLPRITSPAIPAPNLTTLEQATFKAVNAERETYGLLPLTSDQSLNIVAQAHGQDMVARGYFSHVTPEGITLQGRLEEHGLSFNWSGENIQRNVQPLTATVEYAINWFMSSRPHRNNILHDHYNRLGVSVTEGPPGWYTYVLVFAGD